MYNKKTLSKASAELDKAKAPKKPKDMITDPMGQWKYPGLPTRIPSNDITMKGVGYPVLGVANNGQRKIMLPGADYTFPGADYVDEYPQMRKGGVKKKKTKSLSGTNKLMLTHPLLRNYKNKVYDPNVDYFQKGGMKTVKSKDGTVTNRFINEAGDEVVQVKTKDGKYTEKVIPAIQQHKALRDIEKIVKVPFHSETEEEYDKLPSNEKLRRFERTVDVNLGYPQKRAAQVAKDVTEPGNDPVDNIRHPFAGRYTAEAAYNARKKNASWAPDWLNKAGAWVDANALGVGHEATTLLKDKRPWGTKLRESAEDIYNNAVGVNVGLSDRSEREKDMILINKSKYNKIPDGFGEERPFQLTNPKWTDPYDKKQDGGEYIETELTDDEIEEYRKGGYIVEDISVPELNQAQTGIFVAPQLPRDRTKSETTQRVSLPSRQAVIHVKNKPGADKAKKKEKKEIQKFKKQLWKEYEKLPLSEKISDRVGAFINDPAGMTSRALLGEQAYIPGMAQGLHNHENPEVRNRYLKELGYTPGEFDAYDVQSMVNPGSWVTSFTENVRKGNVGTAALEGVLTALPLLPKGTISGSNIKYGANLLKNDVKNAVKYLTEETALRNAYKINPWAFKANPESFYRQIGNEGLTDALSSNTIRSANQSTFPRPHFVEGTDFTKLYSTGEGATGSRPSVIFETSGINQAGEPFVFPSNSTSGYTPWIAGDGTVPLSEGRILQKDWLRGYKEVPTQLPGSPNAVDFSKYLTQEEAIAARTERLISQKNKPGWDEQLTPDLEQRLSTAVENHNPASDYPGNLLGANTAGRTATEVSKNAISKQGIPLNEANKARIAAHEVGHYYSNSPAEGKEWASHFDFSKLSQKSRDYLMGKAWRGRGTDYANEVRERAAQLKDYIAQKNGIPLNQDFIITESMLDDAIANYVKNTGLDNSMSVMLSSLTDKKGLLKTMNKYALGIVPAVIGAETLQQKKQGGAINNAVYTDLTDDEIQDYIAQGYIVEEVDEPKLNQAQKGIIQISDPKEYAYRKKMYDDSLTLHNQSLSDKKWLGSQNPVKRYPDGEHLYKGTAWNKHVYDGVLGFNDAMRRLRLANKKTPTGKKTKFSTTAVINGKDDLNPMYSGHTDFTNFKKPTQEVVLKKENKPVQEVKPVENATYKSKSVKVNNTKYPEGYQPYSLHGRVLDPEVYGYSESINEKPVEVAQFGDTYGYKAKMDEYKKSGKYPWVKQEGGLIEAQKGLSKSQKKSWESLGKQLKKPVIKIPKNAAEAQKMMDSGELDYESWEETKARNIKEAEERKQARLKSLKDYEKRVSNKKYSSLKGLPNEDWREVLANEAAPLGAKFRVSQEDNLFDDYLNPLVMIGSGAQSLGEAPKLAKETNSYMPYVTAVVDPLLTGALSGVGAKNNKQFINNLFNPFASNKTSKYKEPDKIPLTIDDLKNKVEELRTGNGSIKDAEKTFKKIKKESLDFWKTPEGERRVKKYLDENDLTKYGITPQMYSDMMSDINFLDEPTILAAKEKIAKINQARDILNKQKFEISEKIWKLKSNRNKLSDLNNPSTNDLKTIKDIDNELLKLENEISFNSSQDADYMELKLKTPNVDKATGYYNSKNDIIFTGEEWSQPSNTEQTLYHEWGHGKNLKPHLTLDEWFPGTYKIDPVTKKAEDFGKVSPLNKRLRSTIEFEKQTSSGIPEHLDKKLNLDDLYENAQGISALGLQRYTDPKSYYQKALNYFHDSDESNAFLQELLPQFIKKGYIKEQGDLISPQMVEDLFKEYRQESAKKIVEPIRILDIVRPTERSVNRITDELNNLHSLLIGAGAAGATLSDDAESKPELKKGGVVTELSDDEIQDYINQGYVVEDVDDEFQTGGSSSTAKSRLDEINARLQMLERTDEPQYTPKTVTAPVQNIPVSQPVKTAVPVVKQVINKTIEVKRPVVTKPIEKTFQKSKIKQEVKVKTEDAKQKLDKFTKDTLAKIKSQITPTVVPDPNIVNMYKNNYQKHLNSIITDPSKSENLFNNTQLEKEILDRQYLDNVRYGRFDKRGDDVMNRTDFKRNVDSEKYLADIAEDNSVIIDIGSALGNNDPKLSGVSVFELASNPKIKQKNVHVIATDIASGVKDFKTHVKNKTAYDIDYAEVPMNFKTPISKILKDKKLSDKENIYLRTANSIDLLMNVDQAKEHLNHIAKSLKEKTVTYLYNNVILYKPKGKTTFQKLGNINNAGFDHDNKSWLINKNRTPYKLTKPPLR